MSIRKFIIAAFVIANCAACAMTASPTPPVNPAGQAEFERIKSLEGDWISKGKNPEKVEYRVTSGGSVVEEKLFPGTDHEMVSTYFLDHGVLNMVHYCMLSNQPKLQASIVGDNQYQFVAVGGTNVDIEKDTHMHQLNLTLKDADSIRQEWLGYTNGKPSGEEAKVLELTRAKCGCCHAGKHHKGKKLKGKGKK